MSVAKQILKFRIVKPLVQPTRSIVWGGSNHYISGPPQVRIPFWKKMFMGGCFVTAMFSFPYWMVWRMHEWDLIDPNSVV